MESVKKRIFSYLFSRFILLCFFVFCFVLYIAELCFPITNYLCMKVVTTEG